MFSRSTIAMDLGNANTRLYGAGRGVIIEEPSKRHPMSISGCATKGLC